MKPIGARLCLHWRRAPEAAIDLIQRVQDITNKLLHRPVLTVLLIPVLLPFSGCKEKEQAGSAQPLGVEVVAVEQKDVPIYRDWVGTLEGAVNATISAQVSDYLISRNYQEASVVTNNQVLFQIEQAPFQAALDEAKTQLDQAKAQKQKYALDVQRYTPLAASHGCCPGVAASRQQKIRQRTDPPANV